MNFLEQHFDAHAGDIIEVSLDRAANVRILDTSNFARLKRGQACRGYGGSATGTPVRIRVPRTGRWHVVVDLGPRGGSIRASARLLAA